MPPGEHRHPTQVLQTHPTQPQPLTVTPRPFADPLADHDRQVEEPATPHYYAR